MDPILRNPQFLRAARALAGLTGQRARMTATVVPPIPGRVGVAVVLTTARGRQVGVVTICRGEWTVIVENRDATGYAENYPVAEAEAEAKRRRDAAADAYFDRLLEIERRVGFDAALAAIIGQ